jgi:arsenite methyltransferase
MPAKSAKPNYGIDAPRVVRNLLAIGVILLFIPLLHIGPVIFTFTPAAISFLVGGLLMLVYSKWGKFRHRDRMLDMVDWKGSERVLDVGTGRGLLMIGAAKRLTTGKSVGIDIWSAKDLSANSMENTLRNAEMEGVRHLIEVQNGNATAITFADASFDIVLSNLCLHNIPTKAARAKACSEIVRVLKPGGRTIISDFINTAAYVEEFQAAGAIASRTGPDFLFTFPWLRIVDVRKPA